MPNKMKRNKKKETERERTEKKRKEKIIRIRTEKSIRKMK